MEKIQNKEIYLGYSVMKPEVGKEYECVTIIENTDIHTVMRHVRYRKTSTVKNVEKIFNNLFKIETKNSIYIILVYDRNWLKFKKSHSKYLCLGTEIPKRNYSYNCYVMYYDEKGKFDVFEHNTMNVLRVEQISENHYILITDDNDYYLQVQK